MYTIICERGESVILPAAKVEKNVQSADNKESLLYLRQ